MASAYTLYVNNTYRIKRSALQQEAMKKLTEAKIFDQYKEILMISALLGYINKKYVPIEQQASDGVLMQFFNEKDYDFMNLIAFAHTQDQSIIRKDEKYEIFSSYANGGFPILLQKLKVDPNQDIEPDEARKILRTYYMMLLSQDFLVDTSIADDDLIKG